MTPARLALEKLFTARRSALVWRLFRMVSCRDTAEDLAQETFLRAARAVDRGPVEHLPTFLFQTARNLAIDHIRHERRGDRILDRSDFDTRTRAIPAPLSAPDQVVEDRRALERVSEALNRLPPRARQVFHLSRVDGLSYPDIAARLGISESTVYKDMRQALSACLTAAEGGKKP